MPVIGVVTLPGVELSVAAARKFVRDLLGFGHPAVDDVELCVSEAFTNGIQHTASGRGGKVTVALRAAADGIVVEVTDDGADGARPYVADDPLAVRGRGMRIIEAVTVGWGLHEDGDRTTVRMRFPGPLRVDRGARQGYPQFR